MSHFCHFNDYNSSGKNDHQTNDPIFLIYSLSSIRWYISYLYFRTFKTQFLAPCFFALLSSLQNTYLHAKDDTFEPANINIFFYSFLTIFGILVFLVFGLIFFGNFCYITCFLPNLIPIWPQSHGLYPQSPIPSFLLF